MTWTFVIVNITSRVKFVTTLIGLLHTSSKSISINVNNWCKNISIQKFQYNTNITKMFQYFPATDSHITESNVFLNFFFLISTVNLTAPSYFNKN